MNDPEEEGAEPPDSTPKSTKDSTEGISCHSHKGKSERELCVQEAHYQREQEAKRRCAGQN